MREIERIVDQMDRAFSGDAWHGPSLMSALEGLSAEDASKHPIRGAHSIWELVHHLGSWNAIVLQRLRGENVEVTTERDWPPVWEVSETAWRRAVENLSDTHLRLRNFVARLEDDQLDRMEQTTSGGKTPRYVVLHGMVQHNLYHAGQVAILKKALG
ncbi:MAG TPA: DinB family protein [Candidatus Acidoferrales bacterium]|nr:DinB family protein [Candidatus Acidoferrales bacterium]